MEQTWSNSAQPVLQGGGGGGDTSILPYHPPSNRLLQGNLLLGQGAGYLLPQQQGVGHLLYQQQGLSHLLSHQQGAILNQNLDPGLESHSLSLLQPYLTGVENYPENKLNLVYQVQQYSQSLPPPGYTYTTNPVYSSPPTSDGVYNLPQQPLYRQYQPLNLVQLLNQGSILQEQYLSGIIPLNKRKYEQEDATNDTKKVKFETRILKAKRPGFTDERFNETTYYFQNGLRKVYPYYFTFTTFTKGRWVGECLLEVFTREFKAHPKHQYERSINGGILTVNYEKVDINYKLKHNDLLANIVHRHEIPVSAEKIKILYSDSDIVVVDKPPSIPVHPCGRYRHNTMVFILAKEHGLRNLRTIHRLDRLTSGLLMFGRSPAKAKDIETQIRNRLVRKEYICRVQGKFPKGLVQCREPMEVISYKIGVCKVSPGGKDSWTEFERLSYNGETSVVIARPHTGRMHQIRVHFQYLGHPIVNDPLYNHPVFGNERGKSGNFGKTEETLISELVKIHNTENWLGEDGDYETEMAEDGLTLMKLNGSENSGNRFSESYHRSLRSDQSRIIVSPGPDKEKLKMDTACYECSLSYREPGPADLVMFLHALRYTGPNWSHETSLPSWAEPDWKL
ncbi:RNA pseudouridylate synthase domain-containing protein 2 [Eurytemora carolleeae]|uniref:RNA pseudouridylate synthase domain-containing protein 2 n=1 Tax=Eurytemora carolleeae TaxID=1294199 RepID=UPI000C769848|nr:RNA pseudouridylate synthase domain-containing protein 2 [Eurytemora carolleeae]|eukprot:XP_023319674.1 RNA pseudouridylate synthase domain-containing protein 2-like [Eurytemora affinis]